MHVPPTREGNHCPVGTDRDPIGGSLGEIVLPEDPAVFRTLPECASGLEIAGIGVVCDNIGGPAASRDGTIHLTGTLGDPPIAIAIDVDGTSVAPTVGPPADFVLECPTGQSSFTRADANQDGILNVSDAVAIAKAVFGQGAKLPLIEKCMDSADTNDDGAVTTSDAVYLLRYLFIGGNAIPPPNACGPDGTGTSDTLECVDYPPCKG